MHEKWTYRIAPGHLNAFLAWWDTEGMTSIARRAIRVAAAWGDEERSTFSAVLTAHVDDALDDVDAEDLGSPGRPGVVEGISRREVRWAAPTYYRAIPDSADDTVADPRPRP